MASRFERLPLAVFAYEAAEYVAEAEALNPTGGPRVILEKIGDSYNIVDGFHRTAGYLKWAAEQDIDPAELVVEVIVSDSDDAVGDAAEPGPRQEAAIEVIETEAADWAELLAVTKQIALAGKPIKNQIITKASGSRM